MSALCYAYLKNIHLIFLDNSVDVKFIANSSIAERLAMIHMKKVEAIVPTVLYNSGKQNNATPVALLEYVCKNTKVENL